MENHEVPLIFGEYLIHEGIITGQQLQDALNIQICRGCLFGEMAVEKKKMSSKEFVEVRKVQRSKEHPDKKFGEIASALGIFDESNIAEILKAQKDAQKKLGEILVEQKIMSEEELGKHLQDFQVMVSR